MSHLAVEVIELVTASNSAKKSMESLQICGKQQANVQHDLPTVTYELLCFNDSYCRFRGHCILARCLCDGCKALMIL